MAYTTQRRSVTLCVRREHSTVARLHAVGRFCFSHPLALCEVGARVWLRTLIARQADDGHRRRLEEHREDGRGEQRGGRPVDGEDEGLPRRGAEPAELAALGDEGQLLLGHQVRRPLRDARGEGDEERDGVDDAQLGRAQLHRIHEEEDAHLCACV